MCKQQNLSSIKVDEDFLIKTTQELTRIQAVNEHEPPKVTDYTELVDYISNIMKELEFDVKTDGKESFPNIIGRKKDGRSDRCIMLNAHMDTVPEGDRSRWNHNPFSGDLANGFVYGRGACDMRGQIAMILTVAKALKENNIELDGELAVSFVSGHETGSINGSVYLVENNPDILKADLCLIPEPTNFKISVASRGIYWLKATTTGLNGHTAVYNEVLEDGTKLPPVNAIHKMHKFISHILDVDQWMSYKVNPYTGADNGMYSEKPIVEVNLIRAGEKQNTVPGECTATIDIRFLPDQTPEKIREELNVLTSKIRKEDADFDIEIETDMVQSPPMDVPLDSEIYKLASRNFSKVFDKELEPCGVCAPGDAVAFGRIMPVAWLGPTWDNAHGFNEKVSIQELKELTRLYYAIVTDYLSE